MIVEPAPISLLVVGGSAGALEPLLTIVGALPPALVTPIAIALHMAPHQPSLLPQILGHATARSVREAEDKQPLEPGTIYVAPPDYHLLIERAGTLALSVDAPVNFSRPSIDVLFDTAADALGPQVAALVLSGSNHDGAAGLVRVAAAGGLALVQRPTSAAYAEMPAQAAARVPSARLLDPEEIVPFLLRAGGAWSQMESRP